MMAYIKKIRGVIFFWGVLSCWMLPAQNPEQCLTALKQAWELHNQRAYDSAAFHYGRALADYESPALTFGIDPEYAKLARELERIFNKDQKVRLKYLKKSKGASREKRAALIAQMKTVDEENLRRIKAILEMEGWLGPDQVGYMGNKAFFYVIQHADLQTQLEYLPMVFRAMAEGRVEPFQLAYLIDRISLREKRLLMFGSEVRQDATSGEYYLCPTFGIDSLDARRAWVGLQPMEDYLKKYQIEWDPQAYSETLPRLMEKLEFPPE